MTAPVDQELIPAGVNLSERVIISRVQRGLFALGIGSLEALQDFIQQGSLTLLEDLLRAQGGYGEHTQKYLRDALDNPEQGEKIFLHKIKQENVVISGLSQKERDVIDFHWGLDGNRPMTLFSVGLRIGLSRERIRQIRNMAVKRLKWLEWLNSQALDYVVFDEYAQGDLDRLKKLRLKDKLHGNKKERTVEVR